jgi:hypothetical protein
MSRRQVFALVSAVAITACERGKVIRDEPIEVAQNPIKISMVSTGRSKGPTRQVCLSMSNHDADAIESAVPKTGRYHSPLHAVLITKDGELDTLGNSTAPSIMRRDPETICLYDHGLSPQGGLGSRAAARVPAAPEYQILELWSEVPVRVSTIRWWSGQRTGFL